MSGLHVEIANGGSAEMLSMVPERIPEVHREEVRKLYLEQNRRLKDVQDIFAAPPYNIKASKFQWEKRLKAWGFTKNLKKTEWTDIAFRLAKRKRDGKNHDVYLHGILIPRKKIRKETLRYGDVSHTTDHPSSPKLPKGVLIRTPPPSLDLSDEILQQAAQMAELTAAAMLTDQYYMPGSSSSCEGPFMETVLDGDMLSMTGISSDSLLQDQHDSDFTFDSGDMTNMPAMKHPDPAMQPDAGLDCNPLDDVDFSAFLRTSCNTTPVAASKSPVAGGRGIDILYWDKTNYKVMHNLPWFAFQGLITKHIITTSASLPLAPFLHCSSAPGENRKAMFRLVRTDSSFHELEVVKTLSSMVELLPERYDGENSMKLNQLLDPSIQNSNMEAEEIALYLMANNMIKYEAMNRFLEYVTGQKSKEHFRPLFEMKTPTVEAISVRLLEAVATCGAESMLQSLLDAGIDRCHLSGSRGGRLLQIAAYHEVKSVAESLIQSGADVNPNLDSTQVFDLNGAWKWDLATPLENAAFRGNAEMVKLLLEAGAKVDRGSSSQYALALAIRGEKADCIAMLLKAGAKVDDCEVGNMRALDFAFATKKTDIYRMLLASKQPGKIFVTVNGLLLEARRGVSALRRYLKRGGYSDKRNEREALEMALISAVDNVNFSKAIRPLLAFGVNPNTPTAKKEFCPLETAVQNNDIETVELLLGAHADITSDVLACAVDGEDKLDILNFLFESRAADIEYHGPDALSYAIIAENLQAIKLLLRLGVDLDESDDEYFFPIQRAACRGNLEILECIFGASRDSYAPRNRTKHFIALHYAAEEGNLECLRFLLLHGAHINQLQQYRGMTLLQVCAAGAGGDYNFSSDRAEIFKLLLKSGAGINGPNPRKRSRTWNSALTYLLIYSAPEELVQLALEAGADINQAGRGDGARTPLQAAAEVENLGMVKELLRRGADINARSANKNGRTALQAVCMAEYPRLELFEFLLANGADVNAPAGIDGGVTALQGAAMMCHFKIVFRLIECGADVNAEPAIREGRMALDGAAEHGRQDMVQLILNAGAKSERPGETGYDRAIELAERNGHFYMRGLFESYKQTTAAV